MEICKSVKNSGKIKSTEDAEEETETSSDDEYPEVELNLK